MSFIFRSFFPREYTYIPIYSSLFEGISEGIPYYIYKIGGPSTPAKRRLAASFSDRARSRDESPREIKEQSPRKEQSSADYYTRAVMLTSSRRLYIYSNCKLIYTIYAAEPGFFFCLRFFFSSSIASSTIFRKISPRLTRTHGKSLDSYIYIPERRSKKSSKCTSAAASGVFSFALRELVSGSLSLSLSRCTGCYCAHAD